MTRLRILIRRLASLLSASRLEQDLDDEIISHLDLAARENELRGMSPRRARAEALRQFGGVQRIKERYRERRGMPFLESTLQDIRYATRTLRRSPGFTLVVLLTLALGIGANAAIFTLIDALMLRPLPVRDPGSLVQLATDGPLGAVANFSYSDFTRFRDENEVLSGVFAISNLNGLEVDVDGHPEPVHADLVSGNFFSLLGVSGHIGRTLTAQDDDRGANAVVVLSYGYWKRQFALDASIVGRTIALGGRPFTIIGVTPPSFAGLSVDALPDIYIPLMMEPALRNGKSWLDQRAFHWMRVVGRLKPGVAMAQAASDLDLIHRRIISDTPMSDWAAKDRENFAAQKVVIKSAAAGLAFDLRSKFSEPLSILMAMVGLVLLIACANVANLMLARGTARRREIAVRLAIGAGRRRLVRQLIVESVVVAAGGGVLGLLLAYFSSGGLVALMAIGRDPIILDVNPDVRVLAFTGVVSMLAAIVFGLAPAMRATRVDLTPALKQDTRGVVSTGFRLGQTRVLMIGQVAFSLILLCGTGLLIRTLANLESVDPGFDRNNVLLFHVDPTRAGYKGPALAGLYRQMLERLAAIPGVRSASLSLMLPITGGGGWNNGVEVEGYTPRPDEDMRVDLNSVGPGYFETMGTRLLEGREFTARDTEGSPRVAIINQSMARYFFADGNAIGRKFGWGPDKNREDFEIIGVAQDSKYETLREEVPHAAYVNCFQGPLWPMGFQLRTRVKPVAIVPEVRGQVASFGEAIKVDGFGTLDEHVERSLGQERLMVALSSLFGGLALLLTAIGLYGVMAYAVARRTGEIGIRMALGAKRSKVLWMIQRETLILVLIGAAVGLPAAVAISGFISSMLFGLTPTDPLTLIAATSLMLGVAALAGYLPARRASRLDPMRALRYE